MVQPNTDIFTPNHLINGNQWGWITEYGRLVNVKNINGEWWRLITVIFLHSGVVHLITNSIAIYIIGRHMEKRINKISFISIFMICGLISSCFTMFVTNGAVGASGAIYGLIGSYIVLMIKRGEYILRDFKIIEIILLIAYLILPNLSGIVTIIAHLSGFVCGIICSLILDKIKIKNEILK